MFIVFNFKSNSDIVFWFRIEFDERVEAILPETIKEMKKKLFEINNERMHNSGDPNIWQKVEFGWAVEFDVNSFVNLALRKTDVKNFAALNEGNLYNNLFDKVSFKM